MDAREPQGPWEHRHAVVGGVRLHYVEAGAGPLVVLLHGFPEFWYSWRRQIPALAAAGFRVIAPDLRGYNTSDKPAGVGAYRIELLVDDVAGLIGQAGARSAAVVGHDWGGVIAWVLAMRRPDRVGRLAVLNAPHPLAYRREVWRLAQLLRSWYVLFFQLPWLPERVLRAGNFALLGRMLRSQPTRPGAFTPEDIGWYKSALARPGALTAALNYYRAAGRGRGPAAPLGPVTAPTLLIWGEKDPYLGVRLSSGLERWVGDLRVERLPGVSHWVQNDDPERTNALLLEFLAPGLGREGWGE
jgi:pimeloyl-ACP methyl ester carboxylesterase